MVLEAIQGLYQLGVGQGFFDVSKFCIRKNLSDGFTPWKIYRSRFNTVVHRAALITCMTLILRARTKAERETLVEQLMVRYENQFHRIDLVHTKRKGKLRCMKFMLKQDFFGWEVSFRIS